MHCAAPNLASRDASVVHMALEYNVDLPWVMSFHLVPHLPRLVAMVAKFFIYERKVSNLIYYLLIILFLATNERKTQ